VADCVRAHELLCAQQAGPFIASPGQQTPSASSDPICARAAPGCAVYAYKPRHPPSLYIRLSEESVSSHRCATLSPVALQCAALALELTMTTAHTVKSLARHAGELTTALCGLPVSDWYACIVRASPRLRDIRRAVSDCAPSPALPASGSPTPSASHIDINMVMKCSCRKFAAFGALLARDALSESAFRDSCMRLVLAWCGPTSYLSCDKLLCSCVAGSIWPSQSTLCLRVRRHVRRAVASL
jgi:hypothetical protein